MRQWRAFFLLPALLAVSGTPLRADDLGSAAYPQCPPAAVCVVGRPLEVQFSSKEGGPIVLQVGDERFEIDPRARQVRKLEANSVVQPESESSSANSEATTDLPETVDDRGIVREAVAFDFYLVNLPTTRPVARGSLQLRFTHRFLEDVFRGSGRDLFGLDAFSFSSFGFTYGVTRRIAAFAYRSPFMKTLELGASVRLLDEGVHRSPISAYAKASVERTNNFGGHTTVNLEFPISRTVTRHAELFLVPLVSLRANPFPSPFSPDEHLIGLGVGATLKIRPTVALTGEYLARLKGYQPFARDTISWGIQKRTLRHVFQLIISNSFATTTSQSFQGGDFFKLGFNIQRQLR